MLEFHVVTSAVYGAGTPDADHLYFLSDTKEIYRGAVPFTESCVILNSNDLPTAAAKGKIYIKSDGSGHVYNGTSWTQVIKAVATTVTADGTDPVTGKAVTDYVEEIKKSLGGDTTALANRVTALETTVDTATTGLKDRTAALESAINTAETGIKARLDALVGTDEKKTSRAIAAEEVAKIVNGADESFDTLKEIADWISGHKTDAASMNSAIKALEDICKGIGGEGEKATVVAYVTDAINALKNGEIKTNADAIAAIKSDLDTAETGVKARLTTAEAGVAANKAALDTINSTDPKTEGSLAKTLADAKAYADSKNSDMDTRMIAAESKLTTIQGTGEGSITKAAADTLASAKAYTDTALTWKTTM